MHQERENLDFLFRRISPERLLEDMRSSMQFVKLHRGGLASDEKCLQELSQLYHHYAPISMGEYSADELELRFQGMFQDIQSNEHAGLFAPLLNYSKKVLRIIDKEPVCRLEEVLNWNSISKRLGQDVFTSCWLAWMDRFSVGAASWSFTWPAVIRTDDKTLNQLIKKGLAENHFHLHGSTQSFAISWVCLTNHPTKITKIAKDFKENLSFGITRGPLDNVMSLEMRLWYAAVIRELLCRRCLGSLNSDEVREKFWYYDSLRNPVEVIRDIEVLRANCGIRFEYPNSRWKCIDYAINNSFYRVEEKRADRLLAGERSFLYHCFRMQFQGIFTPFESSLLHLYLLIKHNFASELVQNNLLYGFHNFAEYQDRKRVAFCGLKEYEAEALRLSVRAGIEDNSLLSLEARIVPCKHYKDEIADLDRMVQFSDSQKQDWEHFYVIHFPKKKFTAKDIPKQPCVQVPRNKTTRKKAKINAQKLKKYVLQNEVAVSLLGEKQRIFGIDACSKEIGCGPETFATEFRFLRDCCHHNMELRWWQQLRQNYRALGVTYHAGEDFYDIVDGLRSIDEAIDFLCFERGDRIGHALALGIRAKDFYRLKRFNIYLTKQHYLDNLIWLLYRSLEWNIPLETDLRVKFEKKARELLCYIFWNNSSNIHEQTKELDYYYYSWKLRCDHPDVYSRRGTILPRWSWQQGSYEQYMKRDNDTDLNLYREFAGVQNLLKMYHFDCEVKRRGLEPGQLEIDDWGKYSELVTQFQKQLQRKIADAGIAVECNLTSNVLIGTFRRYDAHPILNFNRHKLDCDYSGTNILTSLNTDDLGVFATSLSNEYALLLCALRKLRHMAGNFDDTVIYDYLGYLRECGINMAFRDMGKNNESERQSGKQN